MAFYVHLTLTEKLMQVNFLHTKLKVQWTEQWQEIILLVMNNYF